MGNDNARRRIAVRTGFVLLTGALLIGSSSAQVDRRQERPARQERQERQEQRDARASQDQEVREALDRLGYLESAQEHDATVRGDARIQSLLERIEIGLSALEELGHEEGVALMRDVAEDLRSRRRRLHEGRDDADVRRDRDRERDGARGLDSLQRRLRVLSLAREALAEAGWEGAEAGLGRALRWGKLSLSGGDPEALEKAAAGVPERGKLIEWLQQAARLYREQGQGERAALCNQLAEFYAGETRRDRDTDARAEDERFGDRGAGDVRTDGLQNRARRVEILRFARDGFDEAGNEELGQLFERFVHVGELQLRGGSDEEMRAATQGLTPDVMKRVIGGLREIAGWYRRQGAGDRARACAALAEFYREREAARAEEGDAPAREGLSLGVRAKRLEIIAMARQANLEAGDEAAARELGRFLRIGKLEEKGASPEDVAAAAEGLDTHRLAELLQGAAGYYRAKQRPDRAKACAALAEYYRSRSGDVSDKAEIQAEAARIRAQIEELRARLERLQAEGRK